MPANFDAINVHVIELSPKDFVEQMILAKFISNSKRPFNHMISVADIFNISQNCVVKCSFVQRSNAYDEIITHLQYLHDKKLIKLSKHSGYPKLYVKIGIRRSGLNHFRTKRSIILL